MRRRIVPAAVSARTLAGRAFVVAAFCAALAACTPDVIHGSGPSPLPFGLASTPSSIGVCGLDASARADIFMLTQDDVWPHAASLSQGYANYTLDPATCADTLAATPNPEPVRCDLGFPFYPDAEQVTELARIGVIGMHTAELLNLRTDGTVASMVREIVLNLGPGSGAKVAALAKQCGATSTATGFVRRAGPGVGLLLNIDADRAVALTFDQNTGLTVTQQAALLGKAEALANN
jgi:hypothetical protein